MKRKTAKEILADAFLEVAESKDVDKITVKDIVDNCGYSTATFYRQFRDKYDLIVWAYTRNVAKTMEQIGTGGYEWRQTLLEGARIFHSNRDVLANLLLHTTGHDSFVHHMTEINYQALKAHTEAGEALRERALSVPEAMRGCIDLPPEELLQLKQLLDKALTRMGRTRQ